MRPIVACVFAVAMFGDNELDPAAMRKGESGTLPRTTSRLAYQIADVLDDDVLIVMLERKGGAFKPTARFYFKDRETVERYRTDENRGNRSLGVQIFMPDVYRVVGTKSALPRIAKAK